MSRAKCSTIFRKFSRLRAIPDGLKRPWDDWRTIVLRFHLHHLDAKDKELPVVASFMGATVLDMPVPGNTVRRVTTITFKVDDDEARSLRMAARRAKLTLSEYLRRQIRVNTSEVVPVGKVKCRHTGAMIFAAAPHHPPLSTEAVKAMLADFP